MTRYAVYFAPEAGSAFEALGASAIGRNARTGETVAIAPVDGLDGETLIGLTASPRRYGFHGTLKAPFRLADGISTGDLYNEVGQLAARCRAFTAAPLRVGILSGFVAIVPDGPNDDLVDLAARCVTALDHLRAPLTPEERARRNPDRLSARQAELLDQFGYPYVLDEYRFHMTLSEKTGAGVAARIAAARRIDFACVLVSGFRVSSISVFVEESPGAPFMNVQQFPLGASD